MKMPSIDSPLVESFNHCANRTISSIIIVAILVALAPLLPLGIRHQTLAVTFIMWLLTTIGGSTVIGARAIQKVRETPNKYLLAITMTGIAIALLAVTQLEIIRIVAHRPALIWNVDWRYNLNHAQAIVQTGGVDHSLDYFGAPIDYHLGPAWLAAAVERVFGTGISFTLFGLIPLLSILTIAIALVHILHQHHVSLDIAAAATALTLTFPSLSRSVPHFFHCFRHNLFDCGYWIFSNSFMLNSLFALAIGLAALAFLIDRSSKWRPALGALGLSSVVVLKPQYFAALGLIAGLMGIAQQLRRGDLFVYRNATLLFSVFSLCCALLFMKFLPSEEMLFGSPMFLPGNTGYNFIKELPKGSTVFLIIAAFGWHKLRASSYITRDRTYGSALVLYASLSMALITTVLFAICIPIREEAANAIRELGNISFSEKTLQGEMGFGQALTPLRILLVVASISLLFRYLLERADTLRRIAMLVASICVISPLAFISVGFLDPLSGYEAVDDYDLYRILQHVPRSGTLLIASDIADPAENYRRPAKASYLTAYAGHSFYVSDIAHFNFAREDSVARARNLRAFFGSPWSDWHSQWLTKKGITHILTSDRCVPCWEEKGHFSLKKVLTLGRWTLYKLPPRVSTQDTIGTTDFPPFTDMRPKYGIADCLLIKP